MTSALDRCAVFRFPVKFFSFFFLHDEETVWLGIGRDEPMVWAKLQQWQEIFDGITAHCQLNGGTFQFFHAGIRISSVPSSQNSWLWAILSFDQLLNPINGAPMRFDMPMSVSLAEYNKLRLFKIFHIHFTNMLNLADPPAPTVFGEVPIFNHRGHYMEFQRDSLAVRIHFPNLFSDFHKPCVELVVVGKEHKRLALDKNLRDQVKAANFLLVGNQSISGHFNDVLALNMLQQGARTERALKKKASLAKGAVELNLKDKYGNLIAMSLAVYPPELAQKNPEESTPKDYNLALGDRIYIFQGRSWELLLYAIAFFDEYSKGTFDILLEK